MLWAMAIILILLWVIGLLTATTMGGYIHILLVVAFIVILVNVLRSRKTT